MNQNNMLTIVPAGTTAWKTWCITLLAIFGGCQSAQYKAARLPANLRAQPRTANQNINLAQVASLGTSQELLAPGDLLEITIAAGRNDENVKPILARVADSGSVDLPIIGPVQVAGMDAFDASQNIVTLGIQRGMYRHPLVTVEIKSKAVNQITVLGAVREPGVHDIPRGGCDLVSALAAAGGLDEDASPKIVIIRQPKFGNVSQASTSQTNTAADPDQIQLAAYQNLQQAPTNQNSQQQPAGWQATQTLQLNLAKGSPLNNVDYRLYDRDIVRVIPHKKEVIHVAGLVQKPGQFELPKDQEIFLLDAIALAGGRSSPVADKIFIIRQSENRPEPIVIQASLANAKQNGLENLRLSAGDSITIEQTPATAVVDTISKFFRLSFGLASRTAL